ncbi:MAG: hypothetical protein WCO57_16885 [Verrucomicrobiota bacterium]
MNSIPNNTETVSENTPKAKRGRPMGSARTLANRLVAAGLGPDAKSERSKINFALGLPLIGAIKKLQETDQRRVIGCTAGEIMSGAKDYQPGFYTTATEIGRYLNAGGNISTVFEIILDARDKEIPWKEIKAHFRKLRLGERKGNAFSLFAHLGRAYDEYIRNFPATTPQARLAGIRNLLDAVENPE